MSSAQELKYTATNESVTVLWQGKPVTVKRGSANFEGLKKACMQGNWDEVPHHLKSDSSVERWAKGKFKVLNGQVSYNGDNLPTDLNNRIFEMATLGQDPSAILNFWERLQRNPSARSVEQLWRFLNNIGIPLTPDGCFLAYKSIRRDFKDVHSGTIDNSPGKVVEEQRNKISDDPNQACHFGLHVGALKYVEDFGPSDKRIVICKVDPEHVVCVPNDYDSQKMRVCRYEVIGFHGEALPNTTVEEHELPRREVKGKRSKEFVRLDGLDETLLMAESYEDLRKYASQGLGIIGAYRITGGKWNLVQTIVRARQ